MSLIYAVGDIHGCDAKLESALDHLKRQVRPGDSAVFLGDYIDRGPDSRRVIDLLLDWRETHPDTVFLRGNHEQMMLDAREDLHERYIDYFASDMLLLWWQNGGRDTATSYGAGLKDWIRHIPAEHWEFIESTVIEHTQGGYLFVHAGVLPEGVYWKWAQPDRDARLWVREEFIDSDSEFGGRVVVFGHTPQLSGRPLVLPNKIGLDTAAVFGQKLSVAALDADAQGDDRLKFDLWRF